MTEELNSGGPDKFKLLYDAMASDEVFSQVVPDNFDAFINEYKDPNKMRTLYRALKDDEVFSQVVPATEDEAIIEFGLGKPSPTPQSGSGLGSTQSGGQMPMAQQPKSGVSPSSAQNVDFGFKKVVEEIENPAEVKQPVLAQEEIVDQQSFGEDLYTSLLTGSARLGQGLANTPAFIYDIAAMPQNYIAEKFDIPELKASSEGTGDLIGIEENKVADYYRNQVELGQKKIQGKYDKGITDYFSNGEYQKGFGLLANQIVESAPVTLSLMMGNAAGVSTAGSITGSGLVFGAEKKAQLDRDAPWMTEEQKINAALMSGFSEGIFEQFGLTKIGGVVKNVFLQSGKEAAEKIAKEGFKTAYGKILKQYFGTMAEEALGEASTQFTQNAIAKYSGEKPDQDLFEGVADAFIVGLGASSVYGAAPAIVQTAKTKSGQNKQKEIIQKKDQITQSIELPDVPPAAKGALAQELKKLNEEEADLLISETETFDKLDDNQKQEVNTLEQQANEISQSLQNPEITPDAKAVLEQSLGAIDKQKEAILADAKETFEAGETVELSYTLDKRTEAAQPKVTVEEIKSLPLTRIEGAGMGSNQAVGTFISTEPENRYAAQFPDKEVQSMQVDIENPFVSEDTNLIDFRNELANRRKAELDETDFTEVEVPDGNFTVDDLSDSGIEKVAGMVTEELKAKGYDSIYFPKTETQEGELVVFDRGKARKKGEAATKTVEQLRADEQAELAKAIPNMAEYPDTYGENQGNMPDDLYAVYKPIYDKYDALITSAAKQQTPTQDATQTGKIQPSNQQQREGTAQQQQGQQEDRANQEGNVAQRQAEAGGGNRVAEGGTQQEVDTETQIENFGVPKEDVKPVSNVISRLFDNLKKAGLTAAKNVGEWVGIGKGEQTTNSLKQIIGEKGASRLDNAEKVVAYLGVAREMEKAGKSPKEIRLSTSWEKGSDGKWKFEILSSKPKDISSTDSMGKRKLSSVIDNEELFKSHPKLREVEVEITSGRSISKGDKYKISGVASLNKDGRQTIKIEYPQVRNELGNRDSEATSKILNDSHNEIISVINHEIQHLIQIEEGFALGTNPGVQSLKTITLKQEGDLFNTNKRYKELYLKDEKGNITETERAEMSAIYRNEVARLNPDSAFASYWKSKGEVEARNVQERMKMTPEERRNILLSETEDVSANHRNIINEADNKPLFKDAEAQYRIESGKNIVEAIKDFDGSPRATVALTHEIMHPTVVAIIDGAEQGNEVGAKHTQTIVDEYNKANPGSKVTVDELIAGNNAFKEGTTTKQYRDVQEFIAESWEKYHTEGGKGFSKAFQEVLEQITKAFKAVYQSISGTQLTPELRKMFDEILGKDQTQAAMQQEVTPEQQQRIDTRELLSEISDWNKLGRKAKRSAEGLTEMQRLKKAGKDLGLTIDTKAIKSGLRLTATNADGQVMTVDKVNKVMNPKRVVWSDANYAVQETTDANGNRVVEFYDAKTGDQIRSNSNEGTKAKEAYYEGNIQKFLGKDKPIDIDALLDYYGMNEDGFNKAVLEAVAESDNAFEIAANYQNFVNHDAELTENAFDPDYELANLVGQISEADFKKHFDRNWLNKNSKWVSEDAKRLPLDTRIQEWTSEGTNADTPYLQSLVGADESDILNAISDLVQAYPDGPQSIKPTKEGGLLPLASQRFRQLTGKPLNPVTAYEFNEMFNRYADNQAFGFASKVAWEDLSPQQKQEIIDEQTRPVEDEFFFEGTDFENQQELFAENEQDQGGAEEAKVKPQPIKEAGNKIADAVRKLKISRPDYLSSSLGTAVWDAAVETVASAIEGGTSVAQAIQNAVSAIKESEYYKSITDGQKRKFLSDFIGSVNSSITPEMSPDYSPMLSVGEISKSSLKERMLNGNASKAVKQMIADNGIEFETQNQELARQYANDVIREIGIDAAVDLAQRGVIKGAPKTFILGANVDAKVSSKGDGSLEAMEAINIFDEALRSAGREIAAAYRVYLNSPEGLYAFEKQKVVRNIDKKLSKGQKNVDIKKTKTAVSKEGKSTAKDVAKDVVDGLAGKPPRPKSETSAPKVENEKQKAAQKKKVNALAKLKASSGLTSGGFSKEFFEGLAELGAANIELGYYKVEAWLKQMKKDLKSAGIDNVSDDDILSVLDQPLPDGTSIASAMEAAKWESAAEQLATKINNIFKKPSKTYDPVQSIINGLYQKVAEKVNVEKKKPLSDIDKAKALIDNYEEAKQVWERAKELEIEKIESMDISKQDKAALIFDIDFFFEETIGFPLSETAADKLITNELKDRIKSGESITDAIEKILADAFVYGTNSKDSMIKSISDKLQLNVNLSAADANAIAKKFADRYDKKMSDYAEKFLDKQFKPKPLENEKKRKQQHSAIARQVIWGALDDAQFRAAFYDKYGFDFLFDPKFDQALKYLTKEVYKAPEGFLRDEAQANLNAFVRIAEKGFNYWSIPNSLIVDNLLAGTETMIKALDSNTINTIAIAGQMISKDPKNAKFILEKLFTAKGKKDMLSISLRRMGGWMGLKGMKQRDEADNADISKLLAENHPNKYMRGLGYWTQKSGRALTAIDYATSMPAKYTKFADLMLADVKARGNKLSDGTKVSQRQAEAIVNEILGETTDALQSAMDQAEIDIATMFPNDQINTTAKIPNKATIAYKNRVFEILEQKRMERANDIKSKVDWMADFTEDELTVYEKYASKYADKVSLMGTPNGSAGAVALGLKGVGQDAPILKFLQVAPFFVNAPINLANLMYDSIPLVGLTRAASFMIKGRRGVLISDKKAQELGLFRREDNERIYKEQRNSLLKRVAMLQVASFLGLMLGGFGDDDEERDKFNSMTDYIKSKLFYVTGSLSINPEKAAQIQKSTGLKPYTLYINGTEVLNFRNNALIAVLGLTGNVLDAQNFGNKEDETMLSSYINGVGSTVAFINETSAVRSFSDAVAAYIGIGRYEGSTDSAVDRVKQSIAKSAASSTQAMFLPRVIPSTYKDIQGALLYDKKKATNFLEFMVNDVPFLEDMIVTKQYDHFGEPLKEEFFVPSPLGGLSLIGWENGTFSGPFQEIQSQSKYYRMAQEAGYKPTAYKETKYEVEVSPLEYLALNPSDKIKGLKADRADQGLNGEPKKNEKGMYAFQLNITPEKLAEINQVRGQFVRNWLDKNEAIFLQKTKAERNNILKNLYTTGTTLAKGKVLNLDNEVYRFVPVEVGANGFEVSGAFIPTKLY